METSHSYLTGEATLQWPISPLLGLASGRPISCLVESLRLHPAVESFGNLQFEEMSNGGNPRITTEPIFVSPNGVILSGFGSWLEARQHGAPTVSCIEYPIAEDKILEFILRSHCQRRTWNAFVRIRMALTCESHFREQALENMRLGGKYKGSANLPNASHIDVREEVARLAAVSGRSVSNVRKILSEAHPRVLQALQNGILKINGALQLCREPRDRQLNHFVSMAVNREVRKNIRQLTADGRMRPLTPPVADILEMLRRSNADRPGSVQIRIVDFEQTIVLVGQGLLSKASGPEVRSA